MLKEAELSQAQQQELQQWYNQARHAMVRPNKLVFPSLDDECY
eukprot:SAG31_NODE_14468_length_804_cov_1.704965_2_plen_42_part_01